MEINGIAHIQVSVDRFEECKAFYDQLMPHLGLQAVHSSERFVYYVGGRTAYAVSRTDPQYAGERHVPTRSGLHHVCFRARSHEDIDDLYPFLQGLGATMVRAPEEGPWAPGYYSLSFLDPDGIRLEVNHVPGKGVLAEGASFDPAPDYPVTGRVRGLEAPRSRPQALSPETGIVDSRLMASANLELVRSILGPWERGDYSSVEWAHPEIEYVVADGPMPGRWTGLARMAEAARAGLDAWEEGFRPKAEEYRELDDERVLVLLRFSGRGKTSGLEVGQMRAQGAFLFHVRDGMVTRHVHYWDRERALADLGLAPGTGAPGS